MRREIRYSLKYNEYIKIMQILQLVMKRDKNSKSSGKYKIRTIYFDNYNKEIINKKKNDINAVNKYRIRMYDNQTNSIFLERKINENGYMKKEKEKITKSEAEDIILGKIKNILDETPSLKTELYINMNLKQLRPMLLIEYERTAFIDEISDTRVTLEGNIKSTTDCSRFFRDIEQKSNKNYILEIKYQKYIPDYIKNILCTIERKKVAHSKYRNELEKFEIWG